MRRLLLPVITALAGLWVSPGYAQDKTDESKVAEQPIVIEGKLTADDPKDKVQTNSPHKVHVLKLQAGKKYQIDLIRKDRMQAYDPFLRIEDSTGKQLAANDDGPVSLDSRIDFSPAKDDSYRIVATSLIGQGDYILKITPGGEAPKVEAAKVEAADVLQVKGNLTRKDPVEDGKPGVAHVVKLSAGKVYVIDMMSNEFDAYLKVIDSTGKLVGKDDDGGEKRNARLTFQPAKDDNYRIVATSFGFGQGAYDLTVRTVVAAKVDNKVHEVGNGLRLENALTRADARDTKQTNSFAKIFQVRLVKDKTYTIDLESKAFDCYLRIEDGTGKQLAFDDDGGGDGFNSRLVFRASEDGTYRIIATSLGQATGDFALRIRDN